MRASIFFYLFLLLLTSCKEQKTRETNESIDSSKNHVKSIDDSRTKDQRHPDNPGNFSILITKTDKKIKIFNESNDNGLNRLKIIPLDFPNMSDTLILNDIDPIQMTSLEDLDNNGFDELYIISTSSGSGSYGSIYGFGSNRDLSLSPIYIRPIQDKDIETGGIFNGYQGHDSIFFKNNRLRRRFPIYRENDPNCCPTGGYRTLEYKLIKGEASWILELSKTIQK